MSDPCFCKLYVDVDERIDALQATLSYGALMFFGGLPVELLAYRNENFNKDSLGLAGYDFIECSRYYVEVGLVDEREEYVDNFQSGVAALVADLRQGGRFVTASCDFEDFIANRTGWNWTADDPVPPGRSPQ